MSELESTTVDEITTKIKDLLDSRKNLVTQLKSLNKKRLDMRDEINTITSQLGEHQADLEPLYGEVGSYRKERQGLLNEKKQIWTQINDTNDGIKENGTLSKVQTSNTDRKFNKKEKPYHVHGFEGYSKYTYKYVGNYRYKWYAVWIAKLFVATYPYGAASVTTDKEPNIIDD